MARRSDQAARGAKLRRHRPEVGEPEDVAIPLEPFCVQGLLWRPRVEGGAFVIVADGTHEALATGFTHTAAAELITAGAGVLAVDLMTREEGEQAGERGQCASDLWMLAGRLALVIDWARARGMVGARGVGLLAARAAGAPAAIAASERPSDVTAMALCCRRPDRAGPALRSVRSATLLLVGSDGDAEAHQQAAALVRDAQVLEAGGDTHALATLAARWMIERFAPSAAAPDVALAAPPPA